ncbi:hypothetical protein JHK87_047744 [Glycine soja]|nr:hypothetical protein JHK87_047744 [Glycine soja]
MFEVVGIVHEEAQITLPLLVDFVDDCVNVVKRLRRMKKHLKEMRQWWDEVMKDEEEDGGKRGEECSCC